MSGRNGIYSLTLSASPRNGDAERVVYQGHRRFREPMLKAWAFSEGRLGESSNSGSGSRHGEMINRCQPQCKPNTAGAAQGRNGPARKIATLLLVQLLKIQLLKILLAITIELVKRDANRRAILLFQLNR